MKILGFNPSHHGSVCLLKDGELKFFIQEERIGNREKYSSYPFKSFINLLQNNKIDYITWGTPNIKYNSSTLDTFPYWPQLARAYHPRVQYHDFSDYSHHTCHVAHSFYNSGFKEAIGIVVDGLGSKVDIGNGGQETETVFRCSYPYDFKILYKNITDHLSYDRNISGVYEAITLNLGWSINEAGKTMGLASYGKYNPDLPDFFIGNKCNKNLFLPTNDLPINIDSHPQFNYSTHPKKWHHNESKITNFEKDIAWKVQNDTQQLVGDYIEKAIQETSLKQVCCSGGYFLNCVTNYYLLKRFPGIEFYFEPIANDSGTAIGAAKLVWHTQTQDTTIRPFKSLYLGKRYSKEELLEEIKKYTN